MQKRLIILTLLLLTLAACGADTGSESVADSAPTLAATAVVPTDAPADSSPRDAATDPTPLPATSTPLPTPVTVAEATEAPVAEATAEPTATTIPTEAAPVVTYGQTAEGAFFQGDPAAPVTIIDYSDYL